MDKRLKKALREAYRDCKVTSGGRLVKDGDDRLKMGLMACDRVCWDDDGESWRVYGYIMPSDILYYFATSGRKQSEVWEDYMSLTDDDIREFVDECMTVRIYADYDCTGQSFTRWIDWHRNPCGLISYVHAMALDV